MAETQTLTLKDKVRELVERDAFKNTILGIIIFNAITLGRRILKLGELTVRSYSETIVTRFKNTALIASCQGHSDSGK